jgi:hypothetical protein
MLQMVPSRVANNVKNVENYKKRLQFALVLDLTIRKHVANRTTKVASCPCAKFTNKKTRNPTHAQLLQIA